MGELINSDNIMFYQEDGYCSKYMHIEKAYFNFNKLEKKVKLSIWDDMNFSVWINDDSLYSNITSITCDITIEDKIYFALNRMLGKDNILIIDDDDTREILKNYMEFKRKENIIQIIFHDEDIDKPTFERFKVFIKNIVSDGRSKIEDYNIKYRLVKFFKESSEILTNLNHQYSLDEYYEILRQEGIYKGINPFLSQTNRWFKNSCESCYNCLRECGNSMDYWCKGYIPFNYSDLLKHKNDNDHCATCEYSISKELFESIISENVEYKDLTIEECEKKIGYCELFDTDTIPKKLGYWCPSYLKQENQLVKKLIKKTI